MSDDARARLAARQAELVAALVGQGAAPPGFDAQRVQSAATALAIKRLRGVLRAWPTLAAALGNRFAERFHEYAKIHPLPLTGGPLMDGRMFVRHLSAMESIPNDVLLQALEFDLRWTPRNLPSLKYVRLNNPRRLVVALRLPWLGTYFLGRR